MAMTDTEHYGLMVHMKEVTKINYFIFLQMFKIFTFFLGGIETLVDKNHSIENGRRS